MTAPARLSAVDTQLLVVLDALLAEQSVARAARRLALSPSATSHALARLRDLFGDPLLVRAGRRLVVTARARELAPRVHALVSAMAELFTPAAPPSPAELRRRFVLLTTDHVELVLLRELDPVLAREAPGVDLHSRPITVTAVEELRAGRADLAFGVFGELPPDVRRLPLFEDRLVSLVRAGHPLLRRRLTPERFSAASHVLVAPRGEPRGVLDDQLARLGLRRRVARTLATFLPAPFLVAGSDRVVTLSFRLAALFGPLLGLRRLEPPAALALRPYLIEALWHRRSDDDAGHRFLRETLSRAAARLPSITQPRRAPHRRPR